MRVRVRGIYATAITKVFLDKGIEVSHTSKVIRDRFGIEDSKEPPTVTVKDTEEKHGVVVVGEYDHGRKIYEILKGYSNVRWVSKLPLHAIIKGRVVEVRDGRSIVDLGRYKGVFNGRLEVGREMLFDVSRPFMPNDEYAKLSTRYTVFGSYVALIKGLGRRVVFSRHIVDRRLRRDLTALSLSSNVEDWCVKWRSSATIGSLEDMLKDLRETYERAKKIVKAGEKAEVGELVYDGEFFAILNIDKSKCDEIRNEVVPTIRYHHSLKSVDENEVVDFSESLIERGLCDREGVSECARNYVLSKMCEQKVVRIEHISALKGEIIRLTPGRPLNVYSIKRVFRRAGVFDGLNVKKEPGDYDVMEFLPDVPIILHKYYGRDGKLKGLYVNLNTPPDISRDRIRYVDMEIDVVAGDDVKTIDVEKLERACQLGIVDESLKGYYIDLAERIEKFLKSHDPSEVTIHEIAKAL